MVVRLHELESEPSLRGLRMSADEFLALPESPIRYELVDGVVCMSPCPSFWHQKVITEILGQVRDYLIRHPIGSIVADVDVKLRHNLVYRPDISYVSNDKASRIKVRMTEPPDLIVEIVSPDSRSYDAQTKRADYEAAGVSEYWLIDLLQDRMQFFVLTNGAYREAEAAGERYRSTILPGFELDLARVRAQF